jgi:DNA-binding NtrC family response regulator
MSLDAATCVLVIDDDVIVRELAEALLPLEGFDVTLAASGMEAVETMRRRTAEFDAVLCDLHLPDVAEPQLAAELERLRSPHTPLIAMSATRPDAATKARYAGFLAKPFQPSDVSTAIARARQGSRQEETVAEPAQPEAQAGLPELDDRIFDSLSATLPAAQLLELYALTVDDVSQRVERMRSAQAAGDPERFRSEAHAIKGGCGMVGAVELRELAAAAEGSAMENTPPLAEFVRACARLRRMLDARLT